jgi:hypothetical protein
VTRGYLNLLYSELRPGDTFTIGADGGDLWMVVGVDAMPEKEGWIRMSWVYPGDPQYGVYTEERDGQKSLEDIWPLVQRGPPC